MYNKRFIWESFIIPVYEENAECIAKFHEETNNCSQDAQKNFRAKLVAGVNMDVLIMGACRFVSLKTLIFCSYVSKKKSIYCDR